MDKDTIEATYHQAMLAREAFFIASEKAIQLRAQIEQQRLFSLADGRITGKNAEEREACARKLFADDYYALSEAERDERYTKFDLDQAQARIEMIRCQLRLEESISRSVEEIYGN